MVFSIDFLEGQARCWKTTPDGADSVFDPEYTPTLYVAGETLEDLQELAPELEFRADVVATRFEDWRRGFRYDEETVLRVDVADPSAVSAVAHYARAQGRPLDFQCFNVDLAPEFRYCLEKGITPTPGRSLETLELSIEPEVVTDTPLTTVEVGDELVTGAEAIVVATVADRVASVDPDILVVNTADVVPALFAAADRQDYHPELGRAEGWDQLAGASTFESYGDVHHSPARYDFPGRVLIDRSNTFFFHETNLAGCLDLVERSGKPLQELAWASIGNVLTCIQIQEARDRGVLVPWKSRRHERFKTMRTLHEADRGGFTFAPEVGVHEDVHELDFASLYPNIICTRNVSPDVIRCACHDREDVPGLGYSICDERGYLVDVLEPLVEERDEIKTEIRREQRRDDPDEKRLAALEGRSSALKWILVSCFGYQGFSNAKFGRIECHEAINAYARELLLDAKEILEAHGWRVLHGIVDSLWVTAAEGAAQTPLESVAAEVSEEAGIELEYEAAYDWLAFVPRKGGDAGALTRYFGVRTDGDHKYRGIECRQRSTSEYVASVQEQLVDVFDDTRSPEAVCQALRGQLADLEAGAVSPERLAITKRAGKEAAAYEQFTRTVAALERAADRDLPSQAGQDVEYVVVDDSKQSRDRVRLLSEAPTSYDSEFYREKLVGAAESVLAPVGWAREDIQRELDATVDAPLNAFGAESW